MAFSNSRNIILVDDDPVSVQICNMIFKRTMPDAKIQVFENGYDALQWIRTDNNEKTHQVSESFILLLDLNMPIVDGWGFLSFFEKLEKNIQQKFHIYIMTSSDEDKDIQRATQFPNVKGFHLKPLTHKLINQIFNEIDI